MFKTWATLVLAVMSLTVYTSCASSKGFVYFPGLNDSIINDVSDKIEHVIQKNDVLSIVINSPVPEAAMVFNAANATVAPSSRVEAGISQSSGYLVDQDGIIDIPLVGPVKAAGITKKELKNLIINKLEVNKILREPRVDIRFLNYRVTVLGEVAHPAVMTVPNERITLLEALGMAGDLTIYGKRENVMLIRESQGKKQVARINLNSNQLFASPYYYLQANDIVYVEPNNAKVNANSLQRLWIPVIISAASVAVLALNVATR